ncbi:ATP-binding cassette domain-containing protein [Mucilaginibacter conchicola]|uniref:ATP-binding cassette domain-containing protein n=1 Tax=Mucilaginibacter conchicola TaxID=2303333 RepID=A0A372P015_9SPHI|nr:ATP-binding cassette domain-containing protein [Mucilaginibacter conchicola]RFZ95464.1 ATP-binding cassette domain-containing protein [Mucilaginibacter conchicola]
MINIQSLSKYYGRHKVLSDIDLVFNKGEVYGIVGENGAGKTTLFKCIAGLEDFEGTISYDGSTLKNVTGYLPTELFFFSKMTGQEYLQLLSNARNLTNTDFKSSNIFDLPLSEYAENYSTGMKKKLALTGLLIQKNEVFILDEPFNGVDIHSNLIIKEIIAKLKQLGKIVIMSSHIFSTLNDSCDHLHYLKNGHIKASVAKGGFEQIEEEMKGESVGSRLIDLLNLD